MLCWKSFICYLFWVIPLNGEASLCCRRGGCSLCAQASRCRASLVECGLGSPAAVVQCVLRWGSQAWPPVGIWHLPESDQILHPPHWQADFTIVPPGTSCFKSLKIIHPVWGWSITPHCHNVHIKFECWKLHSLHIVTFLPKASVTVRSILFKY